MTNQLKLRRGTFQHVESELYAYHDTRKEIVRLKNEILYGRTNEDENVGGGRGSGVSDPTARTAVLLTSHKKLEQLQNITDAIEAVYEALPKDKQRLVTLRYWTRPQTLTWEGIAKEIPAHRATAIRWRDEIISAIAYKVGWR
ncbi:transcriptional regulator [Paenibacillus sp. 1011MAR3C5]|uniref:transcriptional regulator n=1 Tax=Paenibacillus sp. 1011MAR3C5 TaxID=1675787 RepID=UPI000E6D0EF3|nr:transcriptional regulator [Paenibacillus sp. 1011MAR3C5]RJE88614.1 transcriptional regulator [Paenibacillus sp. 1011MAR3C5]